MAIQLRQLLGSALYPGGRMISLDLDARLRPTATASPGVSANWTYDLADQLTGSLFGNGIQSNFAFDGNGRLTQIQHALGQVDLYHDQYGYDPVGNRIYTRKLHDEENSEKYTYDSLNRLIGFERGLLDAEGTQITVPTQSEHLLQSQSWTLDPAGNWMQTVQQYAGQQPEVEVREVNEAHEYTQIGARPTDHDHNGNMLTDGDKQYEYDAQNRLIRVIDVATSELLAEYAYDPLGLRVSITHEEGTTYSLFSGIETIEERRADGSLLREFVPDLAMVDHTDAGAQPAGSPEVFYYLQDILGSTVAMTDSAGSVIERYTYEPYGETIITDTAGDRVDDSAVGNPFMWTGHRYEFETGLYHFYARTYSSTLGRWLQRDPLGYIDGVNLYEYVAGSPMNFIDPMGLYVTHVDIENSDGTITRHFYERGVFGLRHDYMTSYRFDPKDAVEKQTAQDVTRVQGFYAAAHDVGNTFQSVGSTFVVIVGILVPGPDDLIWAGLLSRYGFRMIFRGGGHMLVDSAGKVVSPKTIKKLKKEYKKAKKATKPSKKVEKAKKGKEHKKKRPSTKNDHEKGQSTRQRNQGGEKGDERRRPKGC